MKVEQIREGGLTLDEPVSAELLANTLAEAASTGFRAVGTPVLHASLNRVSGGVLLRGDLTVPLISPCKRCLKDVPFELPVKFTLNLVPRELAEALNDDGLEDEGEDSGEGESAGSFTLGDADEEVFDGKEIHLDPIVREQLLLALPMDVVCGEDCKGLCPVCGQNKNEKACGCDPKVTDPRWMALKDIKLN